MPSDPSPNPNPPPSGKPRRRPPQPGMGGNLIWVVVLALLVAWFLFNTQSNAGSIEWGEFWTLLTENKLKKVTLVGDHINGELKDPDDIPE